MYLNPSDVIGKNGSTATNIEIPDISAAVSRDKISKRLGFLYIVEGVYYIIKYYVVRLYVFLYFYYFKI